MTRWLYVNVALAILCLAASFYVFNIQYDQLPEKIPTHWNIRGEPDHFTLKQDAWMHFYLMPGFLFLWVLITWVLPKISPVQFSVEPFKATYGYLMALVSGLFAYLHGVLLWNTLHPVVGFTKPFSFGFFLFFALLGNVLGKTRKNFWIGVRTPWTLADDRVWNQTHRLAGWIFVAYGVLGAILALVTDLSPFLLICGLPVAALYPVLYSLYLYKRLQREGKLASGE
jgi:uncharacterized membrane protein